MPKLVVIFRKQSFKIEYLTTSCKITTPIFFSIDKCFLVVFVCVLRFMEIITGKQTMAFDFVFFLSKELFKKWYFWIKFITIIVSLLFSNWKAQLDLACLWKESCQKKKSKYTLAKKTCKIKQWKKSFDGYARNFKFWKWLNSTMSFHQSFWGVDLRNCGGYDFQKTRQKTIKE